MNEGRKINKSEEGNKCAGGHFERERMAFIIIVISALSLRMIDEYSFHNTITGGDV